MSLENTLLAGLIDWLKVENQRLLDQLLEATAENAALEAELAELRNCLQHVIADRDALRASGLRN